MSFINKIIISFLLFCAVVSTTHADDLGLVTIQNRFQVQVVNEILPYAYTRFENKFLVSFDALEQETLVNAGIMFEIIESDIDVNNYSLVIPPDKPSSTLLRLEKLGNFKALGNGLFLTDLTQSVSLATAEQSGYNFRNLEDTEIRFSYIPLTVSTLLESLDYPTDSLADRVSIDTIYAMNTRLEAFETRYIFSDSIDAARDWIAQKFSDWGYTDVTTPSFYYDGSNHYNVMAVKLGYAEPDKVIVIGGHYDSIVYGQSPGPLVFAPGSDDNGSGTTVTMELARILADIPLRKTVIFMAFSAEEVGLVGARNAAYDFILNSTDIEVMYNFDMVGFTSDNFWNVDIMSGPVDGYVNVSKAAAGRVTSLIPGDVGLSGSSDHWAFYEQGYNICYTSEGDFNTAGWHTNLDLTSRMNFPYLTEIVKMSAAAIGIVANSAQPSIIESVVDMGDGQSLEITWGTCIPEYEYTLLYSSTAGVFTDTIPIPSGSCSYIINGLIEGQNYYFSIVGSIEGGYPAVYASIETGRSLVVPRPPININADPELNSIYISWQKNKEADFAFYRIYRNDGTGFTLHEDNVIDTFFLDIDVVGQLEYNYLVTAVDYDSYESNNSNSSSTYAATFDGGILVVDEIAVGGAFSTQLSQELYIDSIFNFQPHTLYEMNSSDDRLQESSIGRYSSIFYLDDDFSIKLALHNDIPLEWYTSYSNNMFLSGFRTLSFWNSSPISYQHFLYNEFGLASYYEHDPFDFAGATGENGFPTVEVDMSNPFGNLPYILTLQPKAGAQVIYRYDSATDDPLVEGKPCGIMYETAQGKRVLLAFPLYFLTPESARNIINHVKTLFDENITLTLLPGDLNNSGDIDISDLIYLVDYMFITNTPPLDMNSGDVNGSCAIDISDLIYFVNYMFGNPQGPDLVGGCVN